MVCANAYALKWKTHLAYNDIQQVVMTDRAVFVLSGGNIFSIDKQTEQVRTYTLQDGLSSSGICYMHYDAARRSMLLFHENGYLDVLGDNGVRTVSDLYLKQTTLGKKVLSAAAKDDRLYLGMPFGVQVYDMVSRTFIETYFLGPEGAELAIQSVVVEGNQIYAATNSQIYAASLTDNPIDYRHWRALPEVPVQPVRGMAVRQGQLIALCGDWVYALQGTAWNRLLSVPFAKLMTSNGHVLATGTGFYDLTQSLTDCLYAQYTPASVAYDATYGDYWFADNWTGLTHGAHTGAVTYQVDAPANNQPVRMFYCKDKLFVLPGDRWAVEYRRAGTVSMYHNGHWTNLTNDNLSTQAGGYVWDLMSVACDTTDLDHFYLSSYGQGIYEVNNQQIVGHWNATNSGMYDASQVDPVGYTRVDGLHFDSQGNLWFVNTYLTMLPAGASWDNLVTYPLRSEQGDLRQMDTPTPLILDESRHLIWVGSCRNVPGLALFDYAATPLDQTDDHSIFRSNFETEDGSGLTLDKVMTIGKDLDHNVYLCSSTGLYYFSADDDYFTTNVLHQLPVMAGDDEPFLHGQAVNCMAVDAMNRKWVGTEKLGVYLVSADNSRVEAHYTTANSALVSNNVLSLAINPETGTVMIGCSAGLVEFDENGTTGLSDESLEDLETEDYSGMMHGWTFHYAYSNVSEVAHAGEYIYGLADGALFSLDMETEEVRSRSALNGLSSAGIGHIISDGTGRLLVAYKDGNIDIIHADGQVRNLTDLKRKQLTGVSKLLNDAWYHNGKMYMATEFGVLVLNMNKAEFSDWFMPSAAGYTSLDKVMVQGDSLYAASATKLYAAALKDNMADYSFWKEWPLAQRPDISMQSSIRSELTVGGCTYKASGEQGIVRQCGGVETAFLPNGPSVNKPYRITSYNDKLYMVPGGRWASQNMQWAYVMRYEEGEWHNTSFWNMYNQYPRNGAIYDFTRVAVNPTNPAHYAISSYAHGVFEMEGDRIIKVHNEENSPLTPSVPLTNQWVQHYVRTDGVAYDKDGYLWVLNAASDKALKVLSPEGKWTSLTVRSGGSTITMDTPGDVLVDARHPNYRWLVSARPPVGLALYDDNGTPTNPNDDRSIFRSSFMDVNGKPVTPEAIYAIEQDRDGNIWVGTNAGPFMISPNTDFFTSNTVARMVMRRTDGSGLGDYMLGTERINAIAVDGGNRLWFGTALSGVYLMQVDPLDSGNNQQVFHFTTDNSPLPSDNVMSIAILPTSGEVFFGTDGGLVSFRSDASEPQESYENVYAFPNPVRPDYDGVLTISGLVENSSVKICDAAGRTVYGGVSNGGTLVWDLKSQSGHRVTPGVYTIFCNTSADAEESQHGAIKVLVM